jgi:hypothetical protein
MDPFYLKSTELRDYATAHRCIPRGVVQDSNLLVDLEPPLPATVYELPADLERAMLAPRYVEDHLLPELSTWPLMANLCIPKTPGDWINGPWQILDIVELTQE